MLALVMASLQGGGHWMQVGRPQQGETVVLSAEGFPKKELVKCHLFESLNRLCNRLPPQHTPILHIFTIASINNFPQLQVVEAPFTPHPACLPGQINVGVCATC